MPKKGKTNGTREREWEGEREKEWEKKTSMWYWHQALTYTYNHRVSFTHTMWPPSDISYSVSFASSKWNQSPDNGETSNSQMYLGCQVDSRKNFLTIISNSILYIHIQHESTTPFGAHVKSIFICFVLQSPLQCCASRNIFNSLLLSISLCSSHLIWCKQLFSHSIHFFILPYTYIVWNTNWLKHKQSFPFNQEISI